ncbi:MAG: hypothetical protein E6Q58_02875 [Niabella sp.]|nr:MAG: hypothetical protein E6Q58_02875 [Niabella sp.]
MKYIKLIFFSGVSFFVLALIVSFFIPSHISVTRTTKIAGGRDSVLNQVKDLSNWKNWYPGMANKTLENPVMKEGRTTSGSISGVLIKLDKSDDSTVLATFQKGERPVKAFWQLGKDLKSDSLLLQNSMEFDLKWYPWEKFSSLLMDKSYGHIMELGLQNLKK